MTHLLPTQAPRRIGGDGFWRKTWAVLVKEFIQLKRDRVSFAMIIMIPLVQLMLFGYAINTNPRASADRRAAAGAQRPRPLDPGGACKNTRLFPRHPAARAAKPSSTSCWPPARCCSASKSRRNFERAVRRGDKPAMLVVADATDPVAAGSALGALGQRGADRARARPRHSGHHRAAVRDPHHARYNPAGLTQLNIVPGLVGTILTMTMLIFTALSVTREIERGTMENLLSMPITPVEIMLGKIIPYIIVGFVQAAMIIGIGVLLFGVPILGSLSVLAALSTLFIATNLSIGYTFSTIAQNQLQAMQMSMMFFLPNILLSGFMFPFAGMPNWAQWVGEALPLTHYLRIVRAIMLKGSSVADLHYDAAAMFVLMLVAMTIAVTRFRRTLD